MCVFSPVDGADAGDVVAGADPLREEPVTDLPGEHGRVFLFVHRDGVHHVRGGHLRFGAADHARFDRTCFIVSVRGGRKQNKRLK